MKFWKIEEIQNQKKFIAEEREIEAHFFKTTHRDEDGRFVISIPLKRSPKEFGESKAIAHRRLINLERKLQRNETFKQQYTKFLEEYEAHMRRILDEEMDGPHDGNYLPHHCVTRMESPTTKIRVVFDASAATDSGVSLNDLQMVSPTIQEDLLAILQIQNARLCCLNRRQENVLADNNPSRTTAFADNFVAPYK